MAENQTEQQFMTESKPEEEHRWLQKLVGDWTYESEAVMVPGEPPEKMRGAASTRPLGDLWIITDGRGEVGGPDDRRNIETLGYDPQEKRFVGTFVDSGMAFLWLYDGWLTGNVLTLESEGPAMDSTAKMAKYRDLVEVVSGHHWVLRSRAQGNDGQWHEFMTSHYRRQKWARTLPAPWACRPTTAY